MGGKLLKWATAVAILGAGAYAADQLWHGFVAPNLPDRFTNWVSSDIRRVRAYQYGVMAAGATILIPLALKVVGMSEKSPLKEGTSPLKV